MPTVFDLATAGIFSGSREIDRNLQQLEKKFRKRAIKSAMKKSVAVLRKEARKKTPKRTGALRKSLKSDANFTRGEGVKGRLGKTNALRGSIYYRRKGKHAGGHANVIEQGTTNRIVKNYLGNPGQEVAVGKVTAVNMMRTTMDSNKSRIKTIFKEELRRAIKIQKFKASVIK